MNANGYAHAIAEAISPYVGRIMAQTSINAHCKRLGFDAQRLERAQIDPLLTEISLGLNVFIGHEKTERVMREIRTSLAGATL